VKTSVLLPVCAALLALPAALVPLGRLDRNQSLESVARLWGDVFWDINRSTGTLAPLSLRDEVELGDRLAASVAVSWPDEQAGLSRAPAAGARLAPYSSRGYPYRFHVVGLREVNAFALPGGHVYVTRGLLSFVRGDDELAAVLGHEMAHVDLGHCVDRYRFGEAMRKAGAASAGAGELIDAIRAGISASYSQQQEFDADARGVYFAQRAGYNPRAALDVFARLGEARGPAGGGLLRPYLESHPSDARRRANLERVLSEARSR
jgi:beta-barrel assembly-enhancing protease